MPILTSVKRSFHAHGPWTWEVEFNVKDQTFGCHIDPKTGERQPLMFGGLHWDVDAWEEYALTASSL